jgi:CRP-like cAMP-binding protein
VVHVGATTIPEGSGLKRAPEGIENTIILDVDTPLYGPALDTLDLVTSIQLFQGLSMTHAREVLEMARREEYAPGDTIIREGEEGHFMMVIARGHAEVRVNKSHIRRVYDPPSSGSARSGADGKGDMTKQFHVGDYFGEQALVSPDCIRSATILAVSDVEVLRFDRQDFEWIFKGTEVFNRIRRMILAREAATWELLELNSMLAMLSSTQKTQLEQYLSRKRVTKDEVLWAAGEAPPGAIIIDRVPCKLIMNDGLSMVSEDDEPEFMTFRTGALLGEIDAIMDKSKSLSTCIAQGAGEVVFITSIDLFNFFTANPGVYFAVLGKHFVL